LNDKVKGAFSQGREEGSAERPGAKEKRKRRIDPQIAQISQIKIKRRKGK